MHVFKLYTHTHTHSPTDIYYFYESTNASCTHLPEPLNLDIQDHILITRQDKHMATKQS